MRNTLVASAFTMLSIATASAQLTIPKEYLPEVHGTIRGKYELQTTNGMQRFQVRNARVSLDGKVLPVIAYKAEIDLSDEGSIKMLDAYARFVPNDTWNVTLGQMRVPFTIDAHRSPHQQYFANRSFIAKQVGNVRDVGATGACVRIGGVQAVVARCDRNIATGNLDGLGLQPFLFLNVGQLQQRGLANQLVGGCIYLTHDKFLLNELLRYGYEVHWCAAVLALSVNCIVYIGGMSERTYLIPTFLVGL